MVTPVAAVVLQNARQSMGWSAHVTTVNPSAAASGTAPARAGLVLTTLILGALVSNLNLSVANIALPDIGRAFDSTQTTLNLVALGCTLGLAMSVLYLGAIGDRYGRKLLLVLGMILTVPTSLLSAFAPDDGVLVIGRILTGIAAGLAFPTTLALITALWGPGPARVRAIALWSGVSGGGAIIGPVIAGALLESFWWGSVFLIAIPPAVVALVMVIAFVPAHVNESTEAVDHIGGVVSVLMIALLVLGLGMVSAPNMLVTSLSMIAVAFALIVVFGWRQLRAANPLYDLHIARRRLFWVPSVGGLIVFGSLMGAMFIGQQFLQNVLGYSTFAAGLAVIPSAIGMIGASPVAAVLMARLASRNTMLVGFVLVLVGFLIMLFAWHVVTAVTWVMLAYLFVGSGAGITMAAASRSVTGSVPVQRAGMASATADLQRDLGGSIMQAVLGALLAAGYASAFLERLADRYGSESVTQATQTALTRSFASAESIAQQYPAYADAITGAAKASFLAGANWAYAVASAFVVVAGVIVAVAFPGRSGESALIEQYRAQDQAVGPAPANSEPAGS